MERESVRHVSLIRYVPASFVILTPFFLRSSCLFFPVLTISTISQMGGLVLMHALATAPDPTIIRGIICAGTPFQGPFCSSFPFPPAKRQC